MKRYRLLIKLLASAALAAYVLATVDAGALWAAASGADVGLLAAAFSLHGVGYWLSAWRWQILLRAPGYHVPLRFLVGSYLVATFFNNFMPTTVGGDVVRAGDTARRTGAPVARTLSVVVVDRFLGLVAMALFALAAFAIGFNMFAQDGAVGWSLALLVGALLALGLVAAFGRRAAGRLGNVLAVPALGRVAAKLATCFDAIALYRSHRRKLLVALLLSLALQVNVILHYYLIALALHQQAPLVVFFLVVPILTAVLMVAPSINGIGYREAGFVLLLAHSGIATATAVSLSLLAFGMTIVLGLIGAAVFAARRQPGAASALIAASPQDA